MNLHLTQHEKIGILILSAFIIPGLYFGWRLFWFLTDDAFITFRYVSNSILGYGYVWNPAPFRPVEGYSSFLWVVLLDGVWRIFGFQPPEAANVLSLTFAMLTLVVGAGMVLKMSLRDALKPYRLLLLGLAFLGILTNRTFLAWTSSGLETALFNFLLTLWIYCVLFLKAYSREWIGGIAVATGLIALTRPDGVLFAAGGFFLIGLAIYQKRVILSLDRKDLLAAGPLLVIPMHLLWRYAQYGAWLPNTYYAKVLSGRIWPESGLRYFLSFIIEYSFWIWLLLLLAVILFQFIQSQRRFIALLLLEVSLRGAILDPERRPSDIMDNGRGTVKLGWVFGAITLCGMITWLGGHPIWGIGLLGISVLCFFLGGVLDLSLTRFFVVSMLFAHFFYYTIIVGGDHFEYRVYSHLILFLFISAIWLLNTIRLKVGAAVLFLVLLISFSLPIPWTHWAITQDMMTREKTGFLKASVERAVREEMPFLPELVFRYLKAYDELQFWLIDHAVGMRHQEHKVFYLYLVQSLPTRAQGLRNSSEGYPVLAAPSVGVVAWVLPRVNILDTVGLNDYVIARNPDVPSYPYMAHVRKPPQGYLDCFSPNVTIKGKVIVVKPRPVELTADKIVACEKYYEAVVSGN